MVCCTVPGLSQLCYQLSRSHCNFVFATLGQKKKTKVIDNNLDPVWDEVGSKHLAASQAIGSCIRCVCVCVDNYYEVHAYNTFGVAGYSGYFMVEHGGCLCECVLHVGVGAIRTYIHTVLLK